LFHDLVEWLQYELGKSGPDGQSWSNQLWESLFMWNVIEGTHVLTIMFFAGTIWMIDLRMMGVAFTNVPFSKLNDRVLPITMVSFAAMIITGVIVFFGRDPLLYYHNIWFRLKMLFLLLAVINIMWFHYRVQKSQAEWDALPSPPPDKKPWLNLVLPITGVVASFLLMLGAVLVDLTFDAWLLIRLLVATLIAVAAIVWLLHARNPYPPLKVKIPGAISMASWFLIIILGRFIAYDWFYCEKVEPGTLMYSLEECAQKLDYLNEEIPENGGEIVEETADQDAAPDDPPPDETQPNPETPAPGQGG
jgi:hypothetical protein